MQFPAVYCVAGAAAFPPPSAPTERTLQSNAARGGLAQNCATVIRWWLVVGGQAPFCSEAGSCMQAGAHLLRQGQ
eukprot:7563052-Alexandrium_andersonii.AAC.1